MGLIEFDETDILSTMDEKIYDWLENEGKEHWPRYKEIRNSWKGDFELWEEVNVWAYRKLVNEMKSTDNEMMEEMEEVV